jgi:hypothetical protein
MACPTCDHTMHRLRGQREWFWCQRCGTIANDLQSSGMLPEPPKLVGRVRDLLTAIGSYENELARQLGVTESCLLPKDR